MRKLPKIINQEEFEKIFASVPKLKKISKKRKKEYQMAMLLGFEAGMRISEIVGHKDKVPALTSDNVDEASIRIICGKGKKDRIVPRPKRFNEPAKMMLPLKIKRRMLQNLVTKLGKDILGKHITFHTLRHGFVTHLINQGRPLHEVQMLAGHSRLDSVPSYTPIMIREKGNLDIISIEDLWNKINSEEFFFDGANIKKIEDIKIFHRRENIRGGGYWTEIKYVSRHNFKGDLITLNSAGGVIDISNNHSIISKNGKVIDVSKLKVGDSICIPNKESFSWKWGLKDSKYLEFIGSKDLSWLYGFFLAEGSLGKGKEVLFYNFDESLLNKCKKILSDNFYTSIGVSNGKNPRVFITDRRAYNFFKNNFYTSEKLKKIPRFILNANKKVKLAFLEGYNDGDGYSKNQSKFKSFTSNSQVLIAGLLFLLENTTKQDYNLFVRRDKLNITQIELCDKGKRKTDLRKIKKIRKKFYEGWLYDLSTIDEKFCCGIGNIKVHNTTGLYLHANPTKAIEGAREVF